MLARDVVRYSDVRLPQVSPVGNQDSLREAAQPRSQYVKQLNVPPLEQLSNLFLPRILESPNTGYTYAFIPRDFLQRLFGVYGMDLPTEFAKPDLSVLDANDTIPSNINLSTISSIGEFLSASSHSSYLTHPLQ